MGKRRCVGPGPLIDPSRIPTPHFLVVLTAVTQSIAYRILARRSHAVRKRAEAGLAREASLRARARAVTSRANAVQVRARAITVRVNAIAPQGTEAVSVPEIEGIEMVIPDSRSAREREGRSPWTGTFITVVPSAGLSNSMHYDPANTWRVLTRARGEIEDARAGVERLERMLDDAERAIVEGERVLDETEGALRHTEAFLERFAGRIEERWRRSREVGREEVAGERQDRAEVRAEDEEIEGEVDRVLGVFEGALRIAQEATEKEEK